MRVLPVLGTQAPVATRPRYLATATPVRHGDGFYPEERAEGLPFRWMSLSGRVEFPPQPVPRFLELWVSSNFYDLSQRLSATVGSEAKTEHALARGWNRVSVAIPADAEQVLLAVNKPFPREYYPGDGRELALQVRSLLLHADPERHAHVARQHANVVLNLRELLQGQSVLSSTPPKLGIDIQGACNVKPPCVYCAWDFSKEQEGDQVDVPFTRDTLDHWGDFFENSRELVNCSIGEPFMGKNMDELLDAFGDRGKILELTTNGQILTDANIQRLLGRNAHLYISLDAATPATYARLRNDRFDLVLENVRRLVAAKGGPGHLPLIYLVFMPMKANVHEVDAFVRLCAELAIDRLVLRPLNDAEGLELTADRAGYRYEYRNELLPWAELVRISGRVSELCRRLGVELSDQLDFGGSMEAQFAELYAAGRREVTNPEPVAPAAAPTAPAPSAPSAGPAPGPLPSLGEDRFPACTEPWTSLYILRRGVRPCCYGGAPMAGMSGFREAWNSPLMQAIRADLLAGTFHRYCFDSQGCPIVKKSQEARLLTPSEQRRLWQQRLWDRLKRSTSPLRRSLRRLVARKP